MGKSLLAIGTLSCQLEIWRDVDDAEYMWSSFDLQCVFGLSSVVRVVTLVDLVVMVRGLVS